MPSQLINNENVSFVCAKNFTYGGEDYTLGDDFPQEKARDIEVMVRNRFVIPVVDDLSDKPRHWHREVQQRDIVLKKLGVGASLANKPTRVAQQEFDPSEHTVPEVLEHVEQHPEDAADVLESEEEGKERVGITEKLEDSPDVFQVADHTIPQVLDFVDQHPDRLESVIEAEESGKNRSTLLEELYSRLEARDG